MNAGFDKADVEGERAPRSIVKMWRRYGRLSVLITVLLGIVAFYFFHDRVGPTYDGWTAQRWLMEMRLSSSGSAMAEGESQCLDAFKSMGRRAVPFLVRTLNRKPTKIGAWLDDKWPDDGAPLGLNEWLPSATRVEDERQTAAIVLADMGEEAASAIPSMMQIVLDPKPTDGEVQRTVGQCLCQLGSQFLSFRDALEQDLDSCPGHLRLLNASKSKILRCVIAALAHKPQTNEKTLF